MAIKVVALKGQDAPEATAARQRQERLEIWFNGALKASPG
jgi:hypothetical protein